MKKVNYKEKGITLIALVITIIILLILAGVTLNTAISENGLFKRAKEGTEKYKVAQTKEEEGLKELDKYIERVGSEEANGKFENNGIDKTHDGAKYDPVVTDDGMWIIYKDIDTKTTKVNVYVESKYYCPSFEQFVLEKCCLAGFLNNYALPVYSFSDLSDFYARFLILNEYEDLSVDDNYINKRKEEMNVGEFFEELLGKMGVDAYDAYKEIGKIMISELKTGDFELDYEYISEHAEASLFLMGIEFAMRGNVPNITYEKLEATYNKLYGDRKDLEIPETEKDNIYKIKLPDGEEKEIKGTDLYKAKFRYVTTKNEKVDIEITKNEDTPQKITYDKVNNISNCIVKEEEYTYTYNCLPFLDEGSGVGIFDIESMMNGNIDYEKVEDGLLKYRFNLCGWNVSRNDMVEVLFDGDEEKLEDWKSVNTECKYVVNDEPVTCMVGTYYGSTLNFDSMNIPETVVYMFDTFRSFNNYGSKIKEIKLPKSLKYGSYVCYPSENMKFKIYEGSLTNSPDFFDGYGLGGIGDYEDYVEIYK